MMGQVIQFPAPARAQSDPTIERTPELALVLAMLKALPTSTQSKVREEVERLAKAYTDCNAAKQASDIVRMLSP